MSRYTFGSSGYSRTRLPAENATALQSHSQGSTLADPHDPRHLPPAQQIALLTLRDGELASACISEKAPQARTRWTTSRSRRRASPCTIPATGGH
jgi:hypothetical protein